MIVSITTSTIAALNDVTYAQVIGVLSLSVIAAWIGMMCTRVLAASTDSNTAQRIASFFIAGIVPLGIVCAVIFLFKIIAILS